VINEEFWMFSDLTTRPVNSNAYTTQRFTFSDQATQNDLANITAIDLIENGDRAARESWQNRQLTNLLKHAHARSKFWRRRMPSRMITHGIMKCRVRQTEIDSNTIEIGGRESITADEEANLKKVIIKATDPGFNIKIRPVKEIDWSENPKRLLFSSSVA
jgi:hypothetical protein